MGKRVEGLSRVVFVAGGVGINPLVSMLSSIMESWELEFEIEFLYSVKGATPSGELMRPSEILFLDRIAGLLKGKGKLKLYLTGIDGDGELDFETSRDKVTVPYLGRRIGKWDLETALGEAKERGGTVCYVCGVPGMTDWVVDFVGNTGGMSKSRVFCEKWW